MGVQESKGSVMVMRLERYFTNTHNRQGKTNIGWIASTTAFCHRVPEGVMAVCARTGPSVYCPISVSD